MSMQAAQCSVLLMPGIYTSVVLRYSTMVTNIPVTSLLIAAFHRPMRVARSTFLLIRIPAAVAQTWTGASGVFLIELTCAVATLVIPHAVPRCTVTITTPSRNARSMLAVVTMPVLATRTDSTHTVEAISCDKGTLGIGLQFAAVSSATAFTITSLPRIIESFVIHRVLMFKTVQPS